MATKTTNPGLESSIDRLEEKIKLLVNTIGRIKGEQNRVAEENVRLKNEIDGLKGGSFVGERRRRGGRACAKSAT